MQFPWRVRPDHIARKFSMLFGVYRTPIRRLGTLHRPLTTTQAWNRTVFLMPGGLPERRPVVQDGALAGSRNPPKNSVERDVPARMEQMPKPALGSGRIPELIGDSPCMLEVSRRVRLV